MVLKVLEAAVTNYFPTQYLTHIIVAGITILIINAFAQGRSTNRERDLHGRVILVTGAFTPIGLTLLPSLAQRGAHLILLSPYPISSPRSSILVSLLRTTTSNAEIYAEHCDLSSPHSIRGFCERFIKLEDKRVDAVIFAHEYESVGALWGFGGKSNDENERNRKRREFSSMATFLMTTLLLPVLLVAPVERDIRLVTVVNPFYAAASGNIFSPSLLEFSTGPAEFQAPPTKVPRSLFLTEGIRSLRTVLLARHLQRILDALPTAYAPPPPTSESSSTIPVPDRNAQKSNIVAVSVSPGISRIGTVAPLLNADWSISDGGSWLGLIIYLLCQPFLRILTKSPKSAIQTILHVLFLPTPFKKSFASAQSLGEKDGRTKGAAETGSGPIDAGLLDLPEEILKPGALYAECALVDVNIGKRSGRVSDPHKKQPINEKGKGKQEDDRDLKIADDGEYGGEKVGRLIWESYERAVRIWERDAPPLPPPEPPEVEEASETGPY